ncbi:hypothetical protein KWH75_20225 [Morganella morganii]|uniref:hypothetical protein n=1 Tax=Morganella morganii TaxID=582 RepID=UPI0021CF5DBD|nr:hypothetical protein [Morganella morganii]MCU6239392.1 hypothetical protein [Morganella morganii]
MNIDDWGLVAASASAIAAIGAMIASFLAWDTARKSKNLSEQANTQTKEIHNAEMLAAQRSQVVAIWGYLTSLSDIDPSSPVGVDVIKNMNTLELVALCCEGKMVDKDVVMRTFMDTYINLYEAIERLTSVDLGGGKIKSGREIINENNAAQLFYDEVKELKKNQGRINNHG